MNIVDVVKWEVNTNELIHKFESDSLRLGSQLIVYPSQTALFVKGGVIADEFQSGTYTIKSENIPILGKLINIPFNSESPFKAEVWFVNQVSKLDLAWGTPQPIQIEDPKYNIIVPIRAHGQYGIRVSQPRLFLESLIGNMHTFGQEHIEHYFKGKIITNLNTILTQQIIEKKVSVLDINTQLVSLSEECNNILNVQLQKYGISITDFSIMSITVPQDDESVIRLKNAKDVAARLSITGRDVYQMERSFDILEKAAGNHYFDIDISIRDRFTQDYVNNIASVAFLVYSLGNIIDENWGTKEQFNFVALWDAGIGYQNKYFRLLLDPTPTIKYMETYANKIKAYNPEYKLPELKKTSSGGGCYIATSVYGSYDCPEVWTLRRYRDYTLAEKWYGRTFIKIYYAISPTLVNLFGKTRLFKKICKGRLDKFVKKLQSNGVSSNPYNDRNW